MNSVYWLVGIGGALGAMSRVFISGLLPSSVGQVPLKILLINVMGCLALGLLTETMALYGNLSINLRHLLVQGFLGGFTTFSAFALEFGLLYEKGMSLTALLYAILSVVLSIAFFFLGLKCIRLIS